MAFFFAFFNIAEKELLLLNSLRKPRAFLEKLSISVHWVKKTEQGFREPECWLLHFHVGNKMTLELPIWRALGLPG